jgi:hypothetical protein
MQHTLTAFNLEGSRLWEFRSESRDLDGGFVIAGDGTIYFAISHRGLSTRLTHRAGQNGCSRIRDGRAQASC